MKRKIHIVGNWKMNQTLASIKTFFTEFNETCAKYNNCNMWIAPQFIHIPYLQELARTRNLVKVGGQNCSHVNSGAFTGDVSAASLKDMGADFVIIGHSERRAFFQEKDEILNTKTINALNAGLKVIFCVGETLEEREADKTKAIIKGQIDKGLAKIPSNKIKDVIVAYEPVWAIGTGKNATPEQAQEVHKFIRGHINSTLKWNSDELIILYGGSVKPSNIDELLDCQDIDGALVGGASLVAADYDKLCASGNRK
ncbi:MAG: triose-phosphate isomerase [Bdellovibrionales bacterium RIFOXYD12_FULL_39_22]|nr:MAG: triose-phosphate isomerase [Bdellovibrionales bacterium RIFOXYB1_FULL_39_21]OFZ41673.1 MAG: triose-phosphate isomerase [Bdellovibrionales bacterium RIFOXYC12_FULL_39_17]OFZ46073.1 MAG: triose-phosphate isomerase [Bdellovibrionales bacterium RIFOXYC1_FULL_39_130]OFZ74900.1 MAG: triose-phosphate isomerase [Bdellovibrionales bacterium RIFOXYD1_FULL_39_84]OFZ92753.1 MAG: triose-phosphate isomerase [Bdellovibrionales bacterium RIFOXYD12_FULL_39_22]HLE12538.1 triose-phosphate isomerase [Bact